MTHEEIIANIELAFNVESIKDCNITFFKKPVYPGVIIDLDLKKTIIKEVEPYDGSIDLKLGFVNILKENEFNNTKYFIRPSCFSQNHLYLVKCTVVKNDTVEYEYGWFYGNEVS